MYTVTFHNGIVFSGLNLVAKVKCNHVVKNKPNIYIFKMKIYLKKTVSLFICKYEYISVD